MNIATEAPHGAVDISAAIVAAYVGKNSLPANELPGLIRSVHLTVSGLQSGATAEVARKPAVPVKRSITPEHIVCLEDGKKLKMLKRYLRSNYKLSPEEYRAKWALPTDYPMVAPNYSAQRSAFAKKTGLGRKSVSHKPRRKGN